MSGTDDPNLSPAATVLRPRPGGRRAPGDAAAAAAGPSGQSSAGASVAASKAEPPIALQEFQASGRNRLLVAAGPLIALGARLQAAVFQADVPNLRRQAVQSVKQFEERARAPGVREEDVLVARYVICTFVDSAVFRTPWGAQSDWAGQSLLMTYHQELQGGEKFFEILGRLEADPARFIDLLELQYVCLALGFEGKYRGNQASLTDIRERLLATIRSQRGSPTTAALSAHWEGVQDRRHRVLKLLPWWVVGLAGVVILLGVWITLRAQLASAAAPLKAALAGHGVEMKYEQVAPPAAANRLKVLLASAEQQGLLKVEEFGARSLVTLSGAEMFRSGSATLNERYGQVISLIARAAEQVPGTLVVIGHTDDQPVRSLRYKDNFELSRDRAETVAGLLRQMLSDPARVEWTGLGASEPRYEPVELPESRARNRRVEIIHTAVTASRERLR